MRTYVASKHINPYQTPMLIAQPHLHHHHRLHLQHHIECSPPFPLFVKSEETTIVDFVSWLYGDYLTTVHNIRNRVII